MGPLTFSAVSATVISPTNFNVLSTGNGTAAYFAADVSTGTAGGITGAVGASGPLTQTGTTQAPEPASMALLATALVGLGTLRRRTKAS